MDRNARHAFRIFIANNTDRRSDEYKPHQD